MGSKILCHGCQASVWETNIPPIRADGTTCPDCRLARLSAAVVEAAVAWRRAHQIMLADPSDDMIEQQCDDEYKLLEILNCALDALIAARKEASRG